MSLKYKLSITITGLLLVVIVIIEIMMMVLQHKKGVEMLNEVAKGLSVQLEESILIYRSEEEKDMATLFRIVTSDKPFLSNLVVVNKNEVTVLGEMSHQAEIERLITNRLLLKNDSLFHLKIEELNNRKFYISEYHSLKDPATSIFMTYDKKLFHDWYGDNTFLYFFLYIVIAILICIVSYWLLGRTLRPLKNILWKVNEVSSVRFHNPIPITTNDELGVLAFKINAMSQNLSIYMNKLRHAFDENRRMRIYMESFINHSTDAIYIMDMDRKIIQANQAFEELFGFSNSEYLNMKYCNVPENLIKEKEEALLLIQKGESIKPLETFRRAKSGELIPVSLTINPIRDLNNQLTGFANICRDMRHRNRMEELIRRSEKLNTVGQLAAGVAHEIRNPLTTLKGFIQLQKHSNKLNQTHVEVMLSELDRINLIVGEFLILSKPQAVKFKNRDLREIISEVTVFMNSEALMHNVIITETYTKEECTISCEENQLKQVFINLLKNAIEAMPHGGKIHVSVLKRDGFVSIQVIDEGIGMDEDTLSRIGDPFFTAKENGTGLGMMVSQRIIQSHRGQIELSSQVNVGTTVKILLPAPENGQYAEASNL